MPHRTPVEHERRCDGVAENVGGHTFAQSGDLRLTPEPTSNEQTGQRLALRASEEKCLASRRPSLLLVPAQPSHRPVREEDRSLSPFADDTRLLFHPIQTVPPDRQCLRNPHSRSKQHLDNRPIQQALLVHRHHAAFRSSDSDRLNAGSPVPPKSSFPFQAAPRQPPDTTSLAGSSPDHAAFRSSDSLA